MPQPLEQALLGEPVLARRRAPRSGGRCARRARVAGAQRSRPRRSPSRRSRTSQRRASWRSSARSVNSPSAAARPGRRALARCDRGTGSRGRADSPRAPACGRAGRRRRCRRSWRRASRADPGARAPLRSGAARNASSAAAIGGVLVGEDRGGEQRRVGGAGRADRERGDRHAGRHLHDRQQRIEAVRAPWTAPARRAPAARSWPRSCPAGARRRRRRRSAPRGRALARAGGVFEQQVGRAVRGDHAHLVGDAELVEQSRRRRCIVSQSEDEPMMMPTSGFIAALYRTMYAKRETTPARPRRRR